jgi:hypothetical protein
LLRIFQVIIQGLVSILPNGSSMPSQINSAFTTFAGFFQKANAIFPMDTVFTIMGLILTLEASILSFHIGNWIYTKIRG